MKIATHSAKCVETLVISAYFTGHGLSNRHFFILDEDEFEPRGNGMNGQRTTRYAMMNDECMMNDEGGVLLYYLLLIIQ